jgi:hypothetical protein
MKKHPSKEGSVKSWKIYSSASKSRAPLGKEFLPAQGIE